MDNRKFLIYSFSPNNFKQGCYMRIIICQTRDYKHDIHGEKLTCMHLSFGKKINKWKIWLAISRQSNCIDHKMACKACLAWESEAPF